MKIYHCDENLSLMVITFLSMMKINWNNWWTSIFLMKIWYCDENLSLWLIMKVYRFDDWWKFFFELISIGGFFFEFDYHSEIYYTLFIIGWKFIIWWIYIMVMQWYDWKSLETFNWDLFWVLWCLVWSTLTYWQTLSRSQSPSQDWRLGFH